MNPYEELEIGKEFTKKELKSQFRKMCKKHHPDLKKGSTDKFVALKKAYNVLSDPDKKKYFDETGSIPNDVSVDRIRTMAKEGLLNIIEKVIYSPQIMQNYENADVIGIITKVINDNKQMATNNLNKISTEYKTAKKMLVKLKHKGGKNDFVKTMIKSSLNQRKDNLKNLNVNISVLDTMLEIIKEYEYDFTDLAQQTRSSVHIFGNNNGTTTTYAFS